MVRSSWTDRLLVAAIIAVCLAGAWLSGKLLKEHAGDFWSASGAPSSWLARACGAARQVGADCDSAQDARWSELPIPLIVPASGLTLARRTVVVPLAFVGLAYFVFLGAWFVSIGAPRLFGRRWHYLPLGVALAGVATSAGLCGVMAIRQSWCVVCVAVHVLNFVLALLLWKVCRAARKLKSIAVVAAGDRRSLARSTLTGREVARTVAFATLLIAGLWLYRREHLAFRERYADLLPYRELLTSLQRDPAFLLREFYAQAEHAIPPRRPFFDGRGADAAELVIFSDYQCPACYCALRSQKLIADALGENAVITVRHFPLSRDCNETAEDRQHTEACQAPYAAEAARLQGGEPAFARVHELLFKNRKRLGAALYHELATQIGLDGDRLLADLHSAPVRQAVAADIACARALGVTGTPAMFLNGRRVPEICQTPTFWKAIGHALAAARADQVTARAEPGPAGAPHTEAEP